MGCTSAKGDGKKPTTETPTNTYERGYDTIPYDNFISESKRDPKLDYQFGNTLGSGTYGTVIKVKHIQSGDIRAMKKIPKSSLTTDERARKMVNDILILKKLNHPNILKIFEFYQDTHFYYITMEFCQGGELFERMHANSHLCENEAANAIRQVLEVINYSNEQNVSHRDLKPENIMIDTKSTGSSSYIVKIIDWGCAAQYVPGKFMTALVGTPYYIAPEVINRKYTEKCDVWSIGAILYQLLSGDPPFNAESVDELLSTIRNAKSIEFRGTVWKEVSDDAKNFIRLLMDPDTTKRITAADALKHKWLQGHAPTQSISKAARDDCVNKLKQFRAKNDFLDAVQAYIAQYLISKEEQTQLTSVFKSIDNDGNGTLTVQEIQKYFSSYMTPEEVQNVLSNIDKSKDGKINYLEFVAANTAKLELQSRVILRRAFDFFDKDKDGYIDLNELKQSLFGDNTSNVNYIKKIVEEIDTNHDGKISFDEFIAFIPKQAQQHEAQQLANAKR
jgi:calcium-dependent protein kinase